MNNRIAPRSKVILTIVGLVIVLVLLGVLLVLPKYNELGKLDSQIAIVNQQVSVAKSQLAQRQQTKDKSADTNAKWLQLANLVPQDAELPSLIIDLQDAAFKSGVQIIGVTPATPAAPAASAATAASAPGSAAANAATGSYLVIPVQVQILGTWSDTVDYLQRIQKLTRGLRIIEVVSGPTNNTAQANKENSLLPAYFEATTIKLEVYMIPAATASTGK